MYYPILYLIASCFRGFFLIPVTYLIAFGLLFIPPIPLFILTLIGMVISSYCIYSFAESWHLYKYFEKKHKKQMGRIKKSLEKNEVLIIIGWCLLPLVPADLISYVSGVLKVNKTKFLLGILVGQGLYSAIFIFLGKYLLTYLKF